MGAKDDKNRTIHKMQLVKKKKEPEEISETEFVRLQHQVDKYQAQVLARKPGKNTVFRK